MVGLLVLLVLGAIAAGVWVLVRGDGESEDGAAAGDGNDVEVVNTPTVTEEPTEPEIGATPALPTTCTPSDADLTVTAPATSAPGASVAATVTVTVTGDRECLVDLGSSAVLFEVYSGEDRVWSSAQCGFSPASRELLLPPASSDQLTVEWPGWRSNDACQQPEEGAAAGTYRIVVTHTRQDVSLTGEATVVLQ